MITVAVVAVVAETRPQLSPRYTIPTAYLFVGIAPIPLPPDHLAGPPPTHFDLSPFAAVDSTNSTNTLHLRAPSARPRRLSPLLPSDDSFSTLYIRLSPPSSSHSTDDSTGTLYMLMAPQQQDFCGVSAIASSTGGSPQLTAISSCDSNSANEQFSFTATIAMGTVDQSAVTLSTSYWCDQLGAKHTQDPLSVHQGYSWASIRWFCLHQINDGYIVVNDALSFHAHPGSRSATVHFQGSA